jgi:hypothetical protein
MPPDVSGVYRDVLFNVLVNRQYSGSRECPLPMRL